MSGVELENIDSAYARPFAVTSLGQNKRRGKDAVSFGATMIGRCLGILRMPSGSS